MTIEILRADYGDARHGEDILFLLNRYALDPMGGGVPLSGDVQQHLVACLAALPHAVSLLCYVDGAPAGLANCFESFSTFSCTKLLNIHDFTVLEAFRGRGLSQRLLAALDAEAAERGCSKLTLEVLEGNTAARRAYEKFGFAPYQLNPALGQAMFWQKPVAATRAHPARA